MYTTAHQCRQESQRQTEVEEKGSLPFGVSTGLKGKDDTLNSPSRSVDAPEPDAPNPWQRISVGSIIVYHRTTLKSSSIILFVSMLIGLGATFWCQFVDGQNGVLGT